MMNGNKNSKRKGFTLIELLAVIAIIALLAVIAIYAVNNLFKNSEKNANNVSYDSIKKSAVAYANENYLSANYWIEEGDSLETVCVPIMELVNKGFLKKSEIKDISYDFIKVKRDKNNKTIVKESFADDNFCARSSSDDGDGTTSTRTATLNKGNITVSSVSLGVNCDSLEMVANYTLVAYLGDKKINEVTIEKNKYTFSNLNRLTDGKEYEFKAKCNYKDGYSTDYVSMTTNVGNTDVNFSVSDVLLNTTTSKLYKKVNVNFSASDEFKDEDGDLINVGYYFKVTSDNVISSKNVLVCGDDKVPGDCNGSTKNLNKGNWYRLDDASNVTLEVYNNSIVYAKVWDGERYSTNKSIQVTFPTNPYVVWSIVPNIADVSADSGSAIGESKGDINFNVGTWIDFPNISWKIYGGYETKSYVYYDGNNSYTSRGSANKNSGYSCNSNNCSLTSLSAEGKQKIKIIVENVDTEAKTIIIINMDIDKKAPTAPTTMEYVFEDWSRYTRGNWTNKTVYAANTSSSKGPSGSTDINGSGVAKYQISSDGSTWVDYSYSSSSSMYCFSTTGTHIRYFRAVDNAGNESEPISRVALIDKDKPTLTIDNPSVGNWTNANITLTLNYSDSGGSNIDSSSWQWKDNASNTSYKSFTNTNATSMTDTWSGEGDRVGTYRVCDIAGNCVETSTNIKIDKTAPSKPTISNPSNGSWMNSNFKLTLSSSDSYSGIAYYQYTYSDSATATGSNAASQWKTYSDSASNTFTTTSFSAERNQYVYIRACDNVGNCSEKNSTMIRIDKTAPEVTVQVSNQFTGSVVNGPTTYQGGESTINYNNGNWTNVVPSVSLEIDDFSSTRLTINYNTYGNYSTLDDYDSSSYVTRTWDEGYEGDPSHIATRYNGVSDTSAEFYVGSSGKRQIRIYVKDSAGNETSVLVNANVDYNQPSAPQTSFFWGDSMSIKDASDNDESGIGGYGYTAYKDGSLYETSSNTSNYEIYVPVSEYGEGTYDIYGYALDKAGSSSEIFYTELDVVGKSSSSYKYCASGYTYSNGYCVKTVTTTCTSTYEIRTASAWDSSRCWVSYQSGWTATGCINSGRAWYTGDGGKCILYYCNSYYSCNKTYYGTVYSSTSSSCPSGYTELSSGLCYKILNSGVIDE